MDLSSVLRGLTTLVSSPHMDLKRKSSVFRGLTTLVSSPHMDLKRKSSVFRGLTTRRLICLFAMAHLFGAACAADRLVFCHYMMWAPLYNDTLAGFKAEIQLAQSYGIDAFALETMVWTQEYQTRAQNIYEAAKELGTGFQLFFSADLDTGTSLSVADVQSMVTTFQGHPNQFQYQGKQFLTTFAGQAQGLSFWTQVLQSFGGNIFFVPFFPTDGTQTGVTSVISQYSSILSGLFAWDTSAWPYVNGDYDTPSESNDEAYLAACGQANIEYMASVSPWFFTHSSSGSNEVKGNYQGAGLWLTRWAQLVASSVQLVEIISWNDWAERHYVTPVGSSWGPVESDWNDTGFPHQAFLDLGSHYIQWFKTGQEPAVTSDALYMFYYTHSKNAVASNDPVGVVENAQYLDDRLYVTVKLTASATVTLVSGGQTQSFDNVGPGIATVSMAFSEGQQQATLTRNGAPLLSLTGDLPISNQITAYDFNAYTKYVSS